MDWFLYDRELRHEGVKCHHQIQTYNCAKSVQIRTIFWFVFSSIWTEYGDLLRKSPYSVQIRENTDQKKFCISTLFTEYRRSTFIKDRINLK